MHIEKNTWTTYAHELAEHARVNMFIPLDCVDGYWRKLDMSSIVSIDREVIDNLSNRWTEEWHMTNQRIFLANNSKKMMLLKRLRELVNPTTSSIIEPDVKIQKCGKRITKYDASARREPSRYELVDSAPYSCLTPKSENMIQTSTKSIRWLKKKVSLFYTYSNYHGSYYILNTHHFQNP